LMLDEYLPGGDRLQLLGDCSQGLAVRKAALDGSELHAGFPQS
jgi:hypothetical protein